MKGSGKMEKNATDSNNRKFDADPKNMANNVSGKSFASVVQANRMKPSNETPPVLILEDDFLNTKDFTLSLMGRVKEMASLANLKKAHCNEGWSPEFSKEEEEDDTSVEDNINGRNNDHEANNGFEESDAEEVPKTLFEQPDDQKNLHSEDPFGIYPLLNKDNVKVAQKVIVEDHSLSHPPGFTPEGDLNDGNNANLYSKNFGENKRGDYSSVNPDDDKDNSDLVNKKSESKRSGCPKYPVLTRTGGSILNLMEEVVKVGQTMGYNMDGCITDITEIIESQGEFGKNLHSEDPFGIYPLLNKDNVKVAQKVIVEDQSLSHPPGFTPVGDLNDGNNANLDSKNFGENERGDYFSVNPDDDKDNSDSVNKKSES
nr:nucleotide-binding alpha-beta plait domain-containing protein [Tanacetum cinerariifolium]